MKVGKNAPAGDYAGKVRLVCDREVLAEVPYTVHVWNFAIPERSTFKAIYDISLGPGGEALWNQTTEPGLPSDCPGHGSPADVPEPDPARSHVPLRERPRLGGLHGIRQGSPGLLRRAGSSLMPTCLISSTCSAGASRPRTSSESIPSRAIRRSRRPTGPCSGPSTSGPIRLA